MNKLNFITDHKSIIYYSDNTFTIASCEHHCKLCKCCSILLYSKIIFYYFTFIIVRNLRRLMIAGRSYLGWYLGFSGYRLQCQNWLNLDRWRIWLWNLRHRRTFSLKSHKYYNTDSSHDWNIIFFTFMRCMESSNGGYHQYVKQGNVLLRVTELRGLTWRWRTYQLRFLL